MLYKLKTNNYSELAIVNVQIDGEKETCGAKGGLVSGWKQSMKSVSNNEWREVSRSHSKPMVANIGEGMNFRRHKQ